MSKNLTISLAGNPNVGKSTLFNQLTGLNQHTGNWPGKTVESSRGSLIYKDYELTLVDLPGTYSLMSSSPEEEVARNFICFSEQDITVVVADATCLERNLNLTLQILEITSNVILCVNLIDEARKKGIIVNIDKLSKELGIPVIATSGRSNEGLELLCETIINFEKKEKATPSIPYPESIRVAIDTVAKGTEVCFDLSSKSFSKDWLAIKILEDEQQILEQISTAIGSPLNENEQLTEYIEKAQKMLPSNFRDIIVKSVVYKAEELANKCVKLSNEKYNSRDRRIDKLLTSPLTGIPIMLLLLGLIFWLTIQGANYPSQLLSNLLFGFEDILEKTFFSWGVWPWVTGVVVNGMYRTLAWVVSVMLPPMAIFFPLFTLLEDLGYLPRIAFNLDKYFRASGTHGKQALTMCMGFGCNACGVVGCRIIDSPRERLIAILTNNFVPCNGRFSMIIMLLSMFFVGASFIGSSIMPTLLLLLVIIIGVATTFLVSKLLTMTILKGMPSSFALELPPFRKPQICKVLLRSLIDRTLIVLGRAVTVAAPAGIIIWILANTTVANASILTHCASFLDPFARLMGLDGYILFAFILGLPANEIVIPIVIMSYAATGKLIEIENLSTLWTLLSQNGWTVITAICTITFSLFHWPCATTLLSIKKETLSWKWTALAALIPTVIGIIVCMIIAFVGNMII